MLKLCGLQVEYLQITKEGTCSLSNLHPCSTPMNVRLPCPCSGPPSIRFGIAFIERASEQPTRTEKYEWSPPSPPPRAYGRVIGIHRSIHPSLPRSAPFTN